MCDWKTDETCKQCPFLYNYNYCLVEGEYIDNLDNQKDWSNKNEIRIIEIYK